MSSLLEKIWPNMPLSLSLYLIAIFATTERAEICGWLNLASISWCSSSMLIKFNFLKLKLGALQRCRDNVTSSHKIVGYYLLQHNSLWQLLFVVAGHALSLCHVVTLSRSHVVTLSLLQRRKKMLFTQLWVKFLSTEAAVWGKASSLVWTIPTNRPFFTKLS